MERIPSKDGVVMDSKCVSEAGHTPRLWPYSDGRVSWEDPRHSEGLNILFLDGHVEWLTRNQLRNEHVTGP